MKTELQNFIIRILIVHFVIYLRACNFIVPNHNGSTASLLRVTLKKTEIFHFQNI